MKTNKQMENDALNLIRHRKFQLLTERLKSALRCGASGLTKNQKLFAAVLLFNAYSLKNQGSSWLLEALDLNDYPALSSPALVAVSEISKGKENSIALNEIVHGHVFFLRAIKQFEDLIVATRFLETSSEIISSALSSMEEVYLDNT